MFAYRRIRDLCVCAVAFATAGPAVAGFTVESELNGTATNNTIATAQNIQAGFDGTLPANAFNVAGNFSHTSISGRWGSPDVDFYSFTTLGGRAYFDIDNNPFAFDTILSLFDATNTLIAFDDDSGPADAGSARPC